MTLRVPEARTELAFDRDVGVDPGFGRLLPSLGFGKLLERVARFRKINEEYPDAHHDALEFSSGRIVLVTRLCQGQMATVLQLRVHADHDHGEAQPVERQAASIA